MYMRQLQSVLKAVTLVARPAGATVAELESALGVTRRTVYRVLDALQEIGVPVYDDKVEGERQKRWRIDPGDVRRLPGVDLPRVSLSPAESLMLSYVLSGEGVLRTAEVGGELRSLREKLSALVPGAPIGRHAWYKLDSLFVRSQQFAKDYSGKQEMIDTLTEAIPKRNGTLRSARWSNTLG